MHPFPIADAYRIPAPATTVCVIPSSTHSGTIRAAAACAAPGSEEEQHGLPQREIAAHTQREDTLQ
jgi:hypothetical protein